MYKGAVKSASFAANNRSPHGLHVSWGNRGNGGRFRASLLGLLAKIKCSICSYQLNIWYAAHWVAHILNWFLELGCGKGACLVPATGCLGIALPPSTAHFPLREDFINIKKKIYEPHFFLVFRYASQDGREKGRVSDATNASSACAFSHILVRAARQRQPSNLRTTNFILTWRGRQLWSWRQSSQGEALSLHFDWVDPCDYPKCG